MLRIRYNSIKMRFASRVDHERSMSSSSGNGIVRTRYYTVENEKKKIKNACIGR